MKGLITALALATICIASPAIADAYRAHEAGSIKILGIADVIETLPTVVPGIFKSNKVASKMAAGGSPKHTMTRDEVIQMWMDRQETLKELLPGL